MKRERFDKQIIIFLCLLLVVEVSFLVYHLGLLPGHARSSSTGRVVAGYVVKTENELRRRDLNSLVWEKSLADETIYYHDSVLTLAQSSATLHLQEKTDVHLSENTLVTIEPPENMEAGQIRLRFYKGDVRARNPFAQFVIKAESWSVHLEKNSELNLHQAKDGEFEVQLVKGQAELNRNGEKTKVTDDSIVRISAHEVQSLKVDQDLKWLSEIPRRIYSFESSVKLNLKWEGKATQLARHTVGEAEHVEILEPTDQEKSIELTRGSHQFYLRTETATSAPLLVEVWPAPTIHLLYPLTRNRLKMSDENSFHWVKVPGVKKYELRLESTREPKTYLLEQNLFKTKFEAEGDINWQVRGFDDEGFEIPAKYSQPLFIRQDPLAAPKLRVPRSRLPAQEKDKKPNSSWYQPLLDLLLPSAYAEEVEVLKIEAHFAWEPVDGADRYVIEIAESPDFRTPVVNKTISSTEFIWSEARAKTYYWRVASGSKNGRLGFFSEAAVLHLQKVGEGPQEIDGVIVRKVAKPVAILPAAPPMTEAQLTPSPETQPSPPPVELPSFKWRDQLKRRSVSWRPTYLTVDAHGTEQTRAIIKGGSIAAFEGRWEELLENNKSLWLSASFASFTFKAEPASAYPFQPDSTWTDVKLVALLGSQLTRWRWGGVVANSLAVERLSYESFTLKSKPLAGPMLSFIDGGETIAWQAQGTLLIGDNQQALALSASLQSLLISTPVHLFGGFGFDAQILRDQNNSGQILKYFLYLGSGF